MLSAISSAVPLEYLVPIGIIGSLNKRVIFPIAAGTADFITTKAGILSPEEAHKQHMVFDETLQVGINTIVDPVEQTLVNQAKAIPVIGDYIPEINSELRSVDETPGKPQSQPQPFATTTKKQSNKSNKTPKKVDTNYDGFVPYGSKLEGREVITKKKEPRPYDKKLYEQLLRSKEESLTGTNAAVSNPKTEGTARITGTGVV